MSAVVIVVLLSLLFGGAAGVVYFVLKRQSRCPILSTAIEDPSFLSEIESMGEVEVSLPLRQQFAALAERLDRITELLVELGGRPPTASGETADAAETEDGEDEELEEPKPAGLARAARRVFPCDAENLRASS